MSEMLKEEEFVNIHLSATLGMGSRAEGVDGGHLLLIEGELN